LISTADLVLGDLTPSTELIIKHLFQNQFRQRQIAWKWSPPSYDDALNYRDTLFRGHIELIANFGIFNNQNIKAAICGIVNCADPEEDLYGECAMHITIREKSVFSQMFVLGRVCGTGTAVLLDQKQNVYLYRTPGAIQPQLEGLDCDLALVMTRGDVVHERSRLVLLEQYTEACVPTSRARE
jgi:hypothetical protein